MQQESPRIDVQKSLASSRRDKISATLNRLKSKDAEKKDPLGKYLWRKPSPRTQGESIAKEYIDSVRF